MQTQELNQKLDKITLPLAKLDVKVQLEGIFACPDQWKTTDQANPNVFAYVSRFSRTEITGGKIVPRQLTQKQIREQQEEITKKKGGKKQSKENPAQQQKLKKIKEQQLQEQRKKNSQLQKLTQQQRFYAHSQDQYKTFSLKFDKKIHSFQLTGNNLVIFQQRVFHDKGEWIYIYKYPTLSEDQINKLKKGKSKTLNLNDLNPLAMKGWVDYSKLHQNGKTQIRVRCSLVQIQQQPDSPKPNLEKTYALLKINLSQPLMKQADPQQLSSNDLIKNPPSPTVIPSDIQSVNELKKEIKLALQSIGMQYSTMFWKQLNFFEQQKNMNSLSIVKKADLTKRKQQFLYDFNMTGKYKILKERIKKVIVNVCKYKYANILSQYTSFTGISTESKDQFYSEIYHFLVSTTQQTLEDIIKSKRQLLNQTTVPSYDQKVEQILTYIHHRLEQQSYQKVTRLATQYQQLRQIQNAQEIYLKYLEKQPNNLKLKFSYAKFCLRNKLGNSFPSKIISLIYECLRYQKDSKELKLIYLILLLSTKKKTEIKQAWIILRQLLEGDKNNIQYYVLASYLFNVLGEQLISEKFQKIAQRIILRKLGTIPQKGNHKKSPIPSQIPNFKQVCQYNIVLKNHDKDQMWLKLVTIFANYNIFTLIQSLTHKINNKDKKELLILAIRIEIFKGNNKLALEKAVELAQKSPSLELLQLITTITFESMNFEMCEDYLKRCFKYRQAANNYVLYLRLGFVYYEFKKYANSKACLVKILKFRPHNSLAWFKLGCAQLELGNLNDSLNCFREANILNHENSQIWIKLSENYIKLNKYNISNQCLVNYIKCENENNRISKKKSKYVMLEPIKKLLKSAQFKNDNDRLIITKMYRSIEIVQN